MKSARPDTLRAVQPAFLSGFCLGDWLGLLSENSFSVDRRFLGRAIAATAGAAFTSILSRFEPNRKLTEHQEQLWRSPVFVLGLPRSGTTHLHSLLLGNPTFACPSRLDCYNPHTLEILHGLGVPRWLALVPHKKRLVDNVVSGWNSPEEDDLALAVMTADGPRLGGVFGRRGEHYRRRSPLDPAWAGASGWQHALAAFTRKIVGLRDKGLLLKSPWHTAFIPQILAVFPEARFVTIFRHPVDQVRSLLAAQAHTEWCALQEPPSASLQRAVEQSAEILRRYLETRDMIPSQNLTECTYESLVESPLAVLEKIHQRLRIPEFDSIGAKILRQGEAGRYVRNVHPKLPAEEESLVWTAFQPLVERGLYAP
jgi:omega-hydroxy-beta-dihydromenaquinone-9 sulfotransferase